MPERAALPLRLAAALWPAPAGAAAEGEETPALELLEFLGSFETEDGTWVDPWALRDAGPQPAGSPGAEETGRPEGPRKEERGDEDEDARAGR